MREKVISTEARAVLGLCVVEGNAVFIRTGQLERKLYEEVNFVLGSIGGKWNRKAKGHVFTEPTEEIVEMLEGCIETGIAVPLTRGDYFPTPPETAKKLVDAADIRESAYILEPSAGEGNLVATIRQHVSVHKMDAVENDPKRCSSLQLKFGHFPWFRLIEGDFLSWNPGPVYDRVVMNPPFYRLSDIDHVVHAFGLLRKGGRLVSVMSQGVTFRRDGKAQSFRELVDRCGGISDLPAGSFKFSGTGVNTVHVVLDKR